MVDVSEPAPPRGRGHGLRISAGEIAAYSGRRGPLSIYAAERGPRVRARSKDRALIDTAAELVGANRSQFMLASALKETKNVLLDQSTIYADKETFQKVMDWMDAELTSTEAAGMRRLLKASQPL